ncbi:MAG: glycosyltransferase family 4 protein, partial [Acidobacteria bacterium]|nr:glycosyltransferase family 4 protein [Acidobacteriota bacterium]
GPRVGGGRWRWPALGRGGGGWLARPGPDVEFMGWRSDEEIRELYRGARGFLLPGEEDFGIAPVEALACGRPVVGLARGGVTETVSDGDTGVLVDEPTAEAFAAGIARAAALRFDAGHIRSQALRFSVSRFHDEMRPLLEGAAVQAGGAAA